MLLAASILFVVPFSSADAEPRRVNFSGQLDYGTFQAAAQRGQTVTIKYSPGGTGAAALALARVSNVVIDGRCNSACAWSFVRNSNACFTARASFGFHAAHDPGTGRRLNAATGYWLKSVRPSLRGKLDALLGTSTLIRVSAAEMRRHYGERACGAAPRTEVAAAAKASKTVVAAVEAAARAERGRKTKLKSHGARSVASVEVALAGAATVWSVPAAFGIAQWQSGVAGEAVAAIQLGERLRASDGPEVAAAGFGPAPDGGIGLAARSANWGFERVSTAVPETPLSFSALHAWEGAPPIAAWPAEVAQHSPESRVMAYARETSLAIAMLWEERDGQFPPPYGLSEREGAAATFLAVSGGQALNG